MSVKHIEPYNNAKNTHFRNFGVAFGIATSGGGIAATLMSPLLQLSLENLGLGNIFIIYGSFMLIYTLSVITIHQENKKNPTLMKSKKEKNTLLRYKEIFSSPHIVLLLIYLGIH